MDMKQRSLFFRVCAPRNIVLHGEWISTPAVNDNGYVELQINCQVEDISCFHPHHACSNICNATATHKWHDGMPMCKWHFDSWTQEVKDEEFLAERRKALRPQVVEFRHMDSTDHSDQERLY